MINEHEASFLQYKSDQIDGWLELLYRETKSRRKRIAKKLMLSQWDSLLKDLGDISKKGSNYTHYINAYGKTIADLNKDINRVYCNIREYKSSFYPVEKLAVSYRIDGLGNPLYMVRFALYV